jgi:hypothetical protein
MFFWMLSEPNLHEFFCRTPRSAGLELNQVCISAIFEYQQAGLHAQFS